MKEITIEKMIELEADQEFIAKLQNASTTEEKLQVFADYGIELTVEEYENACDQAFNLMEEKGYIKDGELTEAGLELVYGGVNVGVSGVGVAVGSVGLLLMMAGGGWAVWAVGCGIGLLGICMR